MIVKKVEHKEELQQILNLQVKNHFSHISEDQKKKKGFVTVLHSLELLEKMTQSSPQIIAVDKQNVIAYALVMLKEFKSSIPILIPLFQKLETIFFKDKILSNYRYYIMGQICVDESYRGRGLVSKLYQKHKEVLMNKFDLCITEVSSDNIPSMKAHLKMGFINIYNYNTNNEEWNILVWDWNTSR